MLLRQGIDNFGALLAGELFNNSTNLLCSGNEDDSKKIEASATHAEKIIHAAAAADRNGGVAGLFIDTAMVS